MKQLNYRPLFNFQLSVNPTTKSISQLSPRQLLDPALIKRICQNQIPKHTIMSQFCLQHGKQQKSGNQTCFSEKSEYILIINRIRRSWYPIVQKQTYKSLILSRRIHVKVTTKTMKCFRKAGSLDNYILLTKPQDQDFTYEEYLRKLMLTKIDAPLFELNFKTSQEEHKDQAKQLQLYDIHLKLDIKINIFQNKNTNEMYPQEFIKLREYDSLKDKFEETDVLHPVLQIIFQKKQLFILQNKQILIINQILFSQMENNRYDEQQHFIPQIQQNYNQDQNRELQRYQFIDAFSYITLMLCIIVVFIGVFFF
ncbi:unnamed protein product [Paramecium sonneborni]|uniref:Ribosomal protein L28 n=1 Tax=Paramecium sonneborni TaxID=65129 RepID=A0A8S1RXZ5_9CILI|nr:unnamed protein product [Paramecium sonneborni]